MISALLSGESIKSNGTLRKWNCVEYYGHHRKNNGVFILRVFENNLIKQINLSTFSGNILTHGDEIVFHNGKKISLNTYYLPF